jgi:hypothetical protein
MANECSGRLAAVCAGLTAAEIEAVRARCDREDGALLRARNWSSGKGARREAEAGRRAEPPPSPASSQQRLIVQTGSFLELAVNLSFEFDGDVGTPLAEADARTPRVDSGTPRSDAGAQTPLSSPPLSPAHNSALYSPRLANLLLNANSDPTLVALQDALAASAHERSGSGELDRRARSGSLSRHGSADSLARSGAHSNASLASSYGTGAPLTPAHRALPAPAGDDVGLDLMGVAETRSVQKVDGR